MQLEKQGHEMWNSFVLPRTGPAAVSANCPYVIQWHTTDWSDWFSELFTAEGHRLAKQPHN